MGSGSFADMLAKHPVDAVASKGFTEPVEKYWFILCERLRTRVSKTLTVADQSGQRRILRLLPLSCVAHLVSSEVEIANLKRRRLGNAGTRVI